MHADHNACTNILMLNEHIQNDFTQIFWVKSAIITKPNNTLVFFHIVKKVWIICFDLIQNFVTALKSLEAELHWLSHCVVIFLNIFVFPKTALYALHQTFKK